MDRHGWALTRSVSEIFLCTGFPTNNRSLFSERSAISGISGYLFALEVTLHTLKTFSRFMGGNIGIGKWWQKIFWHCKMGRLRFFVLSDYYWNTESWFTDFLWSDHRSEILLVMKTNCFWKNKYFMCCIRKTWKNVSENSEKKCKWVKVWELSI